MTDYSIHEFEFPYTSPYTIGSCPKTFDVMLVIGGF